MRTCGIDPEVSPERVLERLRLLRSDYEAGNPRAAPGPIDALVFRLLVASGAHEGAAWVESFRRDLEVSGEAAATYDPTLTAVLRDLQAALGDRSLPVHEIVRRASGDCEYASLSHQIVRLASGGDSRPAADDPLFERVVSLARLAPAAVLRDLDLALQEALLNP